MPEGYPKIPNTIRLPQGYLVQVKLKKDAWFSKQGWQHCYAAWVSDHRGGGTIYLRESLPYHDRWSKLLHEMRHVFADWEHYVQETIIEPFMIELGRQVIEEVEDGEEE